MPRAEVCAAEVRFAHATALLYLVFLALELAAQRAALPLAIGLLPKPFILTRKSETTKISRVTNQYSYLKSFLT